MDVSFGYKVIPSTFGCVVMRSDLLFIVRSRFLIFYRVRSEQSASCLFGFSKRILCFVQTKMLCRYGCMYFLAALVLVCVDVMVMSSA